MGKHAPQGSIRKWLLTRFGILLLRWDSFWDLLLIRSFSRVANPTAAAA